MIAIIRLDYPNIGWLEETRFVRPITWHQVAEQDRVIARKEKNGPFYTGRVTSRKRLNVIVTLDDGSKLKRPYDQVFYPRELVYDMEEGTSMVIFLSKKEIK